MTAPAFLDLVRMSTATVGTGTITLGAAVNGYLAFAAAGAVDGTTYRYAIQDGNNSEVGTGVYSAAAQTLTRSVTKSTNSNNPISLSGRAQVIVCAAAEDLAIGGTTFGTAAAQSVSAFLQPANNLSDLGSAATARTNLGLGTAAVLAATAFLAVASNLSDLGSAAAARGNLGLGTAAVQNVGAFLQPANNFSDVASAATARSNLGLGSLALQSAGAVAITGGSITGLSSPVNPSDAATKSYVDATAAGLSVRDSCAWATAAALAANTYANGTGGVGATLTANANGALSIDGNAPGVGDRVLVQNEATASHNGLYTVTAAGSGGAPYVLTRASDFNSSSNVFGGIFTFVEGGAANAGAGFVLTTTGSITLGTTALAWTQFSGAGEILPGTGLAKSGNTLSRSRARWASPRAASASRRSPRTAYSRQRRRRCAGARRQCERHQQIPDPERVGGAGLERGRGGGHPNARLHLDAAARLQLQRVLRRPVRRGHVGAAGGRGVHRERERGRAAVSRVSQSGFHAAGRGQRDGAAPYVRLWNERPAGPWCSRGRREPTRAPRP